MTSPAADDVGYGEEPSPEDLRWQAAADALTPEKILGRINANARATVGTVAFVGTLLAGMGLASATSLLDDGLTRALALVAAALATGAVVLAVVFLTLRLERLNIDDIDQVKDWYARQFRRAYLAVVASWLLLAAVLCAAATTAVGLSRSERDGDVALDLQLVGTGADRSLHVGANASGLAAGAVVRARVTAIAGTCPAAILLDSVSRASHAGTADLDLAVQHLPCNAAFRLTVSGDDIPVSSIRIP